MSPNCGGLILQVGCRTAFNKSKRAPPMATQRLRQSEINALSGVLLELYCPGPTSDLPQRLFNVLRRCFPFDFFAYHEIVANHSQRHCMFPEYNLDMHAFETYLKQHPTWNAFVKQRAKSPLRISDLVPLGHWHRTDLYNHIFRPRDQNYQLAYVALDQHPQVGVAFNRSTRDFSDEERLMLQILRPHIVQAYRTSTLFSSLSETMATQGRGYLIADQAGHIRFATDAVFGWLREYFVEENGARLPTPLMDWLKSRRQGLSTDRLATPLREFCIERGEKRLTIQCISPVESTEYRLVLTEAVDQGDASPLETLGLTKREAEVLLWVSRGKRNSEIGLILGTRERTIYKHLERVFAKLSVETRTAAANIVFEHLRKAAVSKSR
jgi:DNA-binding CsgD family transcriptional regulator